MAIGLQMTQCLEMRQQIQLSLEQRLEQRVQIQQLLAHDFSGFINIEGDEDEELLHESLPFMVMHEVSHPLYDEGKIYIPELQPNKLLQGMLTDHGYQMAHETGIDKAGMLIGQVACDYSSERMVQSHVAIVERVYRDVFELQKFPFDEGFIARLQCELQIHALERMEQSLHHRVDSLANDINRNVKKRLFGKTYGLYRSLVAAYGRVYQGTRLTEVHHSSGFTGLGGFFLSIPVHYINNTTKKE